MTNSPQEPGDQPDNVEPASSPPASVPYPAQPGYVYPPYPAMPPEPMPPAVSKKTGVVIAAVVGLVAGIGIGAGGFAIATSDDDPQPSADTTSTRTPPIATDTTTTGETGEEDPQGDYSMDSVTNACDLIDLTMVHRWQASTPYIGPENFETRPRSLGCQAGFSDPSTVDEFATNQTGINFDAEFAEPEAVPAYDNWKARDTSTTGSHLAFGEVTGIGSEGYWFSEKGDDLSTRLSYTVAVRDSNLSVKVRISLSRGDGEPPVTWEEMDEVARAEVRLALEGLKK